MERTEPTLIPEWLKNSASSTGGSSQSHADDRSASRLLKSKSCVHYNGHNFGRPSGFERNGSSYLRRGSGGSSSGSFRSYISSGRNQLNSEWEKDKFTLHDQKKSVHRRHWDFSEPEGTRHAQFMISGEHGDTWLKKVGTDQKFFGGNTTDSLHSKVSLPSRATKTFFEKDFPSLGTDERSVVLDVGRVPSPGLTTAIQSLPIGSSPSLGEKWTSALAEVPILAGSNGSVLSSASQVASSGSKFAVSRSTSSLNMAEAVTHGPIRAQTSPQKREDLAIKQSRKLIPVIPSLSKTSALGSSDKSNVKAGTPVLPSVPVSPSQRGVPRKSDSSKSSNPGKLLVLKSAREKNGLTSSGKDSMTPTSNSKLGSSVVVATLSAASGNPMNNSGHKPALTVLEKRRTSQAQSRNDFFNSVRKKSMEISSSSTADLDFFCSSSVVECNGNAASPSFSGNHHSAATNDEAADIMPSSVGPQIDSEEHCNGDACNEQKVVVLNGKKHWCSGPIFSEEKEAAFLRSLGWEDNDEEGGLTDEEISSFLMNLPKYIESNPSFRILPRRQLRFLLPPHKEEDICTSDAKPES